MANICENDMEKWKLAANRENGLWRNIMPWRAMVAVGFAILQNNKYYFNKEKETDIEMSRLAILTPVQ